MEDLVFRQKAIDDLSEIWDYTFHNWSETQADKYYEMPMRKASHTGE
jgi:toxin ParE1/3/4